MASIQEIFSQITACIHRCQTLPQPSAARFRLLQQLTSDQAQIARKLVALEQSEVGEPLRVHTEQTTILNELQASSAAHNQENRTKVQDAKKNGDQPRLLKLQQELAEYTQRQNEAIAIQQGKVTASEKELTAARAKWSASDASDALMKLEMAAGELLTSAGELERNFQLQTEVEERAQVDFVTKEDDFKNASTEHNKKASTMLWIMAGLTILGGLSIYFLFVDLGSIPMGEGIEHLALLSVGRLAILLFFAWALKYAGSLHKSHSEQAIIYRDRAAALGVASNLLKSAPDLQRRQELLQTLARGYLDFEQNAFHSQVNDKISNAGQIREAIEVLRPVLAELRPFLVTTQNDKQVQGK